MDKQVLVEICAGSAEDCIAAKNSMADRVELVSAHALGGLTPSMGLMEYVKDKVGIPVMAIVRPRMSGFHYSETEFAVMCSDGRKLAQAGAAGLVCGFLRSDGSLDYERCAKFREIIGDREAVFHRAFDIVKEPEYSAELLIKLGYTRILTSGRETGCQKGKDYIRALEQEFGSKIQIMAGGGINEENIEEILKYTGVKQVHFGGTVLFRDSSCEAGKKIPFGITALLPEESYIGVSRERIQKMIRTVRSLSFGS